MNSISHVVPPGFRFHPTDEELVDYYLRKRVASKRIDLDVIKDVDLYRIEPWDLDEICKIGSTEDQSDYYFFSHKDKKYPTGTRTNRATKAGFWKATGRDKAIYAKHCLVGMRKTLVFYKGRAPNGQKLDWIMHEYRLETNENAAPQEEGWVVCRVFKKKMIATTMRTMIDHRHESPYWYDEHASFMPDMESPMRMLSSHNPNASHNHHPYNHPSSYSCKQEQQKLSLDHHHTLSQYTSFIDLPQLESPKMTSYSAFPDQVLLQNYNLNISNNVLFGNSSNNFTNEEQDLNHQVSTDWRVLDKFVASQLSHEDGSEKQHEYLNNGASFEMDHEDMNEVIGNGSNKVKTMIETEFVASSSTSRDQVDQWK